MNYQTLKYEFSENVATITLNRQDNSANALNAQMTEELLDVSVKMWSSRGARRNFHSYRQDVLWWWRSSRDECHGRQARAFNKNGYAASRWVVEIFTYRCTNHYGN